MSKTIYIVWCYDDILEKLMKYVNLSTKFNLLGTSENGYEAFEEIKELKPQMLVISNEVRGIDGIALLSKICDLPDYNPEIFFYSAYPFVDKILNTENIYFHLKPVDPNNVYHEIAERADLLKPLDGQIKQILFDLKIPVKLKGYMYLRYAAELCYKSPEIMFNLSKNLYPKICEKYDAICPLNVEKAIKNAVSAGCKSNQDKFSKVPSNKEILKYILEKLNTSI